VAGYFLRPIVRWTLLNRTTRLRFEGLDLVTNQGVFPPIVFGSTRFFARHVERLDLRGMGVLEVGTGSGAIALCAAKAGARVVAVDINPTAVSCATGNAARNGLADRVEVFQSDLLTAVKAASLFDYILFNPPHFPEDQAGEETHAWNAGKGFSLLERFAAEAREHLQPQGRVMLVLSADMPVAKVLSFFRAIGYEDRLIERKRWFWDIYYLYSFAIP
jgi:release factor glutamine methyltransferase